MAIFLRLRFDECRSVEMRVRRSRPDVALPLDGCLPVFFVQNTKQKKTKTTNRTEQNRTEQRDKQREREGLVLFFDNLVL